MSSKERRIVAFHPSPFMVSEVNRLIEAIAPNVKWSNLIVEDLLMRASNGITDEVIEATKAALQAINRSDAPIVLCTCSTLGGIAEELGRELDLQVVRIDRAMAESAVMAGKRIGIVAAVKSTFEPTSKLIRQVANEYSKDVSLNEVFVDGAWEYKQAGDEEGYLDRAEQVMRQVYASYDALVLAQGSMAKAAERCKDLPVPIFSSPRLGVEAVITMAKSRD